MQVPSVAVVILNYNGDHFLRQFLPSVAASTYANLTIVLADNASTDGSADWVEQNYPAITIIVNKANYGYALGYNMALTQVEADYFVLLNSDVEVTPGWIEPVITLMESNPNVAACQPKLLAYENKTNFEYAGACGGWIDALGYPFSRGRIFEDCEKDNGQYDTAEAIFWASGAAFFVRSAIFRRMNGFEESFFAHQEEIDLCWRMQSAGYIVMVCPQSVVYHVGGGTLPKGKRKVMLNFRNNLMMLSRNMRPASLVWKLPVRIILDMIAATKGLISGDAHFFLGVLNGYTAYFGWLMRHKSGYKPSAKLKPILKGWYNGSIVWQYYIARKKTFAQIIKKSS